MPSPIAVIGGGPAGLYFSIQMKLRDPARPVTVVERNPRGSTFGWGVVFSDGTLGRLRDADPESYREITERFVHWDDIDVHYRGRAIRSGGHGFCGIARQALLDILIDRAEALDVDVRFGVEGTPERFADGAGLIVAADGVNSAIRARYESHFRPDIDVRLCRYVWLGTQKPFDAFTFYFEETAGGWYQAHCYPFGGGWSTFIVECTEETWRADGLERASKEAGIAFCERLFARHLDGHRLVSNAAHLRGSAVWLNFPRVNCETWHHGNVVLLGDSAATAHFSVGSGTRLAMESAISLAEHVHGTGDLAAALAGYESERRVEVLRLQNAARNSTEWFEQVGLKANLEPEQFTYSLITRSQRVSHESLRARDARYLESFESWLCARETGGRRADPVPPMFLPFRLREMELVNRVVCSPMAMYSAVDGAVTDFHLVHFGARALGGAGLLFSEMTCVSPEGRITPGCAGLYEDAHVDAWRRIVDFVHRESDARMALQLGPRGAQGVHAPRLGGVGRAARCRQLAHHVAVAAAVDGGERNPARDDARRHGSRAGRIRRGRAARDRGRLRRTRAPLRARLSPLELHLSADQRAPRRVRRLAREPDALPARGSGCGASGLAGGETARCAHLRDRLGRGRNRGRGERCHCPHAART